MLTNVATFGNGRKTLTFLNIHLSIKKDEVTNCYPTPKLSSPIDTFILSQKRGAFMDDGLIYSYFNIEKKIAFLKKRISERETMFYQQSMYTHLIYTNQEIFCEGFKVDEEVILFLKGQWLIERQIERNSFRLKHFKRYLDTLCPQDRNTLKRHYTGEKSIHVSEYLIRETLKEIEEIETAVCFRYDVEPEQEEVVLTGEIFKDIENMCEVFAI